MTLTAKVQQTGNGFVLISQDNSAISPVFMSSTDLGVWLDSHCWSSLGDGRGTMMFYPSGFIRKLGGQWQVSARVSVLSSSEREIFDWGVNVFAFVLGYGYSLVYPLEAFAAMIRKRYQPAGKTIAFLKALDRVIEATRSPG